MNLTCDCPNSAINRLSCKTSFDNLSPAPPNVKKLTSNLSTLGRNNAVVSASVPVSST